MDREETIGLIRERHSVRSYLRKDVEQEKKDIIRSEIDRLNSEHGLHMQLMDDANGVYDGIMSKMMKWKNIPCYIALVGKDREGLDEACGYCGEELAILIQSLGLNTCWAGMYRKSAVKAEVLPGERLCLTLALGYGETQGSPRKSKSYGDVTDVTDAPDWFKEGVESALLAPTAINQQKFRLSLDGDEAVLSASSKGPFVKVDLGIVKYHFEAASGHRARL